MAEYYFNLPPFDVLNDAQKAAVLDESAIALSGGPGTGKSVVSLWRHIINHTKENPLRSQLLTFTTTLAHYLKKCCETQNNQSALSVHSTLNWWYNHKENKAEIIIDEAQDMPLEFNKGLLNFAPVITYGADDQQILKSGSLNPDGTHNLNVCSPERELNNVFRNQPHELNKNYRSTQRIMLFAREFFYNSFVPREIIDGLSNKIGDFPRLLVTNGNLEKLNKAIIDIIEQYQTDDAINIAILQPFANQPWQGTEHWTAKYYYDLLKNRFEVSYYDNSMGGLTEIKNIHCTPFKSSKGLEFDVVIIPNINIAHNNFNVINWRDFFVGVTRAKSQLILFNDKELPNIRNFLEIVTL